jgi:hypothetical protein
MNHDPWAEKHREIERIVLLSEADAFAELTRLRAAERSAYDRYTSAPSVPRPEPGTPQAAGLGSWVCDFNRDGVQDRWHRALEALKSFERIRSGRWDVRAQDEAVCYSITIGGHRHEIEVDHHGVDLTDCPNPAAAIAKVRRIAAA